jgi:hypothetical protein
MNTEILEELKVEPVDEKLRRYKANRLPYVTRMNKMLNYRLNGRKRLAKPLKILSDEAETGLSRPNS